MKFKTWKAPEKARLAIIDLTDNAKQPMIHRETGVVLAFNGEIYNFRELQKKYNLNASINSDTRIILEIYLSLLLILRLFYHS